VGNIDLTKKRRCGPRLHPFVSFDTKGLKQQMLRHAHFYMKGGFQTFAASANWECVNSES
jgi:hypothetical protein